MAITIAYAVVALLWILTSDGVAGLLIRDPDALVEVGQAKGVLFVAVTSVMLLVLMDRLFGAMELGYTRLRERQADVERLDRRQADLIGQLELKTDELEASNRSLQRDIAAREFAESALRESEANFRLLTEAMPQLVWISRGDGWNVFCNRRWVEYTGQQASESAGQGWRTVVHPEDARVLDDAFAEAQAAGDTMTVETRLRDLTGGYRWWLIRAVPRHDEAGTIVRWFGTCTDIDDLRRAATQLHETEEQLRQAQKMEAIGRLAGGVAHDFNNLLTVILGYADVAIESLGPDDPLRDDIVEIGRAGQRAADLTRQLLAFSRRSMIRPRVLDLRDVVHDLERLLRRLLGEDVTLTVHADTPGCVVYADASQLEQIVMNLVVNARDAMPRGGTLTIEVIVTDVDAAHAAAHPGVGEGRYVAISVSDTGVGMDEATRERIFEPFFTTKARGKGTGLGLATVFGIVSQAGGFIDVESAPGEGTTFRVQLPRTELAPETGSRVGGRAPGRRGTGTILLVEDDEQVRTLNGTILRRHGYTVLEAADGPDAIRLAEQLDRPIDLLLTDVVMPRMNGRELAERIAGLQPEVAVLYVSGHSEDAIVIHGVLDPGIAFVQKPITSSALLHAVDEALRSRPSGDPTLLPAPGLASPAVVLPSAPGARSEEAGEDLVREQSTVRRQPDPILDDGREAEAH